MEVVVVRQMFGVAGVRLSFELVGVVLVEAWSSLEHLPKKANNKSKRGKGKKMYIWLFKKGGNYEKNLPPSKEKESRNTMYVAWGTGSDKSNEHDAEDIALMAMEDSEAHSESDTEKR
ncbi:hypothetical protein H5410_056260 [Solanum commersonii]|uniref:Uncharacterized protein n=1 Tax=Solanum commersonii TaxID=4109 RepID=A0A9J5WML1_SOLCO|nr:hypothetical protein H5410_056260 [Solanum commersonii]